MKRLVRLTVGTLLLGLFGLPACAAFTSLYVFGDGICTTTNGPGGSYYYVKRYCNGRVWIEDLAQWQGLSYDSNKNWSYYGHYSTNMAINVNNFVRPADSNTVLYVVWACDADLVYNVNNYGTNITQWTNSINRSLTNHFKIITNLFYAKGARALIMPNAVDLGKVPIYINYAPANKNFIRQRTIEFNTAFAAILSNAVATLPGLKIYPLDVFALFDNVSANPADYGLMKPGTAVNLDLPPSDWGLNGPGTNYIFWDDLNPTAKFQMWIADAAQRLISSPELTGITCLETSNQLDMVNIPAGRNGVVEASSNWLNWTTAQTITSTNTTLSVLVPASAPMQLYRLRFPFAWTWP